MKIVTVDKRQEFQKKFKSYIKGLKSPRSLSRCQFPIILTRVK